jgi:hypothetical protein
MKCRFLDEHTTPICRASLYSYELSEFEFSELCSAGRYKMCAYYCKRIAAEDAAAPRERTAGPHGYTNRGA